MQQLALFPQLTYGLLQAGFRRLPAGNVPKNDEASSLPVGGALQRPAGDADIDALWLLLITHEDLNPVRLLTLHGKHERILVHRQERFLVETKNPMQRGPFLYVVGGFTHAADPYRA